MPNIKFVPTSDTDDTLVLSGIFRPSRLIKNIKHTWRRRRPSSSTRPVKRAKDRREDLVVYTLEGSCDSAVAEKLESFSKDASTYYFYNPLISPDTVICGDHQTRCPASGGNYGYDQIVFTSCEVELLAGKKPGYEYKYRINLEEAKEY